jgi:hypothetical protein
MMAENSIEGSPTAGGSKNLLLIIGGVLILGVAAAAVFGLVLASRMGWIGGGTEMLVGFPDQDAYYDIYLLEIGQSEDEGVRLAKDAQIGDYSIYVFQDQDYTKMISGAGFVPDSSYVFLAYQDDEDAVFEQMTVREDQPEDLFNTDDYPVLIAMPEHKNVVIIEYSDDDARCYLAPFGQEADRVAKGTDCIFLPDGETLIVVEEDNGEYTFTALDLASGDENKFLELDGMVDMYQVSFDGSLMAYVEDTGGEQELHLVNIKDEEEDEIAEGSRIPDFGFAPQSTDFYFIVEDDEGNLSLHVNEEDDPIAEGMMLAAQFGPQGKYLIFSAGDELDDLVVSSYSLRSEEAEEIADGEGLEFAVVADPEQVIVVEAGDDGDLVVYSSSIDGKDVVEVLDENDVYSWDIWSVPGHEFLYFVLYTADDTFGFAYPYGGEGFFFVEEWASIYLLNVSPNGKYMAFSGIEDAGDDPILYYLELEEGSDPEELDDEAEWFVNAVFTKNSRELLYTVETGTGVDEVSINQVVLDDGKPEELYEEAYLLDVEWGDLTAFEYLNFAYMAAGESYCPGAISLSPDDPVDVSITEGEMVCFRFSAGAGEVWNLDIDSFGDTLDLEATLLDSDGFYLSYNDDGLYDLDPWLAYRFDQSGVYFVEVDDLDNAAGDFTITLLESDDSFATAEPYYLGENLQGMITERSLLFIESPEFGDEPVGGFVGKVFTVDMEGDLPISFYAYADSDYYEVGLALLDSDGVWIEESYSETGYGEAILEVAPFYTDTYYLLLVILDEEGEPEFLNVGFELYSEGTGGFTEGYLGEIGYNETIYGYLYDGVRDEWRFYGEAGDALQIALDSVEFDPYLELVDPDGLIVADDDDSGGDRNSEIVYELEITGYFTIIARAYGDSGEGEYALSLEEVLVEPTPEPTEVPETGGGEIEIDEVVSGTLIDGTEDFWTFSATAGTTILIELVSENFDCVLELRDEDGNELAYDDDSAGDGDSLIENFTLDTSGTFVIVARAYNNSGSGVYELALLGIEENDIDYGDLVSGALGAGAEDFWTFSGASGDTITIALESDDFDTVLQLLDGDGFEVAYDDDGGGNSNSLIWNYVLPETGYYTILVRAFSDEGAGDYDLRLEETIIIISGTISYGEVIDAELTEDERQVWAFDGTAGDVVTISLESADFDAYLELRNDSGVVLLEDDDGGDDRNSLIEAYTLDDTGTYWIVVRSYRVDQWGDFTLSLIEE